MTAVIWRPVPATDLSMRLHCQCFPRLEWKWRLFDSFERRRISWTFLRKMAAFCTRGLARFLTFPNRKTYDHPNRSWQQTRKSACGTAVRVWNSCVSSSKEPPYERFLFLIAVTGCTEQTEVSAFKLCEISDLEEWRVCNRIRVRHTHLWWKGFCFTLNDLQKGWREMLAWHLFGQAETVECGARAKLSVEPLERWLSSFWYSCHSQGISFSFSRHAGNRAENCTCCLVGE